MEGGEGKPGCGDHSLKDFCCKGTQRNGSVAVGRCGVKKGFIFKEEEILQNIYTLMRIIQQVEKNDQTRGSEILCMAWGRGVQPQGRFDSGNMKVSSDRFHFLSEIKELSFMDGMGDGALLVQKLIAETGLQAQKSDGYLRLIRLRTFTVAAFLKGKRRRPEG